MREISMLDTIFTQQQQKILLEMIPDGQTQIDNLLYKYAKQFPTLPFPLYHGTHELSLGMNFKERKQVLEASKTLANYYTPWLFGTFSQDLQNLRNTELDDAKILNNFEITRNIDIVLDSYNNKSKNFEYENLYTTDCIYKAIHYSKTAWIGGEFTAVVYAMRKAALKLHPHLSPMSDEEKRACVLLDSYNEKMENSRRVVLLFENVIPFDIECWEDGKEVDWRLVHIQGCEGAPGQFSYRMKKDFSLCNAQKFILTSEDEEKNLYTLAKTKLTEVATEAGRYVHPRICDFLKQNYPEYALFFD